MRQANSTSRDMSEEDPAMEIGGGYVHDDDVDDEDEDEDADEDDDEGEDNGGGGGGGRESSNKQPRLMRACDTCRRKKVKCNGTKPSCTHCTRMKLACHYSPLVRKKRVRRSIIDKLEERLESMEQMLQPLVERLSPNDPVVLGAGGFALGFGFAPAPPPAISHPLGLPAPHQHQYQVQPHAFYAPQIQQQQQQQQPPPMLPPVHVIEELMDIAFTRMTPTAPPVSWAGLVRRLHSGQLPEYIVCATVALA
ncbi:hypothetical protein GGH95_005911, partial [Coemansia sp. RSA 1836]